MKNIMVCIVIIFLTALIHIRDVDRELFILQGEASWYSECDPGILETTANMERFCESHLTCAIWGMPFNAILKVTNLENGRFIFVRVNDRGPAKRLVQKGRIIDLTKEAFSKIGDLGKGLIRVAIEVI